MILAAGKDVKLTNLASQRILRSRLSAISGQPSVRKNPSRRSRLRRDTEEKPPMNADWEEPSARKNPNRRSRLQRDTEEKPPMHTDETKP